MNARYRWRTFSREIAMLVVAAVWWIPFYFLILMAVRPADQVLDSPLTLPRRVTLSNFHDAWTSSANLPLQNAFLNSVIITVCSVVLVVLFGSACAYAIARRPGRSGTVLYLIFSVGIVLPFQLGIVPAYSAMQYLGLVGNYGGMVLLNVGLQMPLAVFLYTGFARRLPPDYEEAATLDGAGPFRVFRYVVFPLLRPVTGTVAILTGIAVWNDFFNPLIFLGGTSSGTLPLAIYSFVSQYATQWNLIFAAVIISLVPMLIFFVVAQRQMVQGFAGGLKG